MKAILHITCFLLLIFSFLSSNSQITFRHVYGGTGQDHGRAIKQTPDGGYIVVGSTGSFGNGASDVYLFKIDSSGNQLWSRTYGGPNVDWGYDVKVLPDSGFIIAGYTNSFGNGGYDMYLLRTDSVGDTLWTKTYGGSNWDFGYKVIHTSDNGFAIVGETQSYGAGEKDVYLVKTNQNGDTLWTKTYGGDSIDVGHSLIESSYGGYFLTGYTKSYGAGKEDIWIIRINSQGDTLMTETYGGVDSDIGNDIVEAIDSTITICGHTESFGSGGKDVHVSRRDTNLSIIWSQEYGGTPNEAANSISSAWDNGFVIGATTDWTGAGGKIDFWMLKVNPNGVYQFATTFGDGQDDICFGVDTINNEFVLVGSTESYGSGFNDALIIKTDVNGDVFTTIDTTVDPLKVLLSQKSTINTLIYPNPTRTKQVKLIIKGGPHIQHIKAYTITGKSIDIETTSLNENQFLIEIKEDVSGLIFIRTKGDDFTAVKKLIVE